MAPWKSVRLVRFVNCVSLMSWLTSWGLGSGEPCLGFSWGLGQCFPQSYGTQTRSASWGQRLAGQASVLPPISIPLHQNTRKAEEGWTLSRRPNPPPHTVRQGVGVGRLKGKWAEFSLVEVKRKLGELRTHSSSGLFFQLSWVLLFFFFSLSFGLSLKEHVFGRFFY